MKGQENIDRLFERALKDRSSGAPSEGAWQGASALLDQHYRKLALRRWIIGSGIVLTLSVVGLLLWSPWSNQGSARVSVSSEQPIKLGTGSSDDQSSVMKDEDNRVEHQALNEKSITSADNGSSSKKSAALGSDEPSTPSTSEATTARSEQNEAVTEVVDVMEDTAPKTKSTLTNTLASVSGSSNSSSSIEPASVIFDQQVINVETASTEAAVMLNMPPFKIGAFALSTDDVATRDSLKHFYLMHELRKVEVLVEGGVMGVQALQNTRLASQNKLGFGAMGGLAVQYHFHTKLFARSGALVHTRGLLNSDVQESVGFSYTTVASPIRLTYVDIPFEVGYRSNRHSLHFGLVFSPLIGARTQILKVPNDGDDQASRSNDQHELRRTGFATFDVAGTAGYRYQISERLSAFGNVRFGLFDVTDNAHFGTAIVDDRNHQLRIGLSYRILHR